MPGLNGWWRKRQELHRLQAALDSAVRDYLVQEDVFRHTVLGGLADNLELKTQFQHAYAEFVAWRDDKLSQRDDYWFVGFDDDQNVRNIGSWAHPAGQTAREECDLMVQALGHIRGLGERMRMVRYNYNPCAT